MKTYKVIATVYNSEEEYKKGTNGIMFEFYDTEDLEKLGGICVYQNKFITLKFVEETI